MRQTLPLQFHLLDVNWRSDTNCSKLGHDRGNTPSKNQQKRNGKWKLKDYC